MVSDEWWMSKYKRYRSNISWPHFILFFSPNIPDTSVDKEQTGVWFTYISAKSPKGRDFPCAVRLQLMAIVLCGWWFYEVALMDGSMVWRQQMHINGTSSSVCEAGLVLALPHTQTYSSSNDVGEMTSGVRWRLNNESSIQSEFRYCSSTLWPLNPRCSCCLSLETANWTLMSCMESTKTPKVKGNGLNWLGVPDPIWQVIK